MNNWFNINCFAQPGSEELAALRIPYSGNRPSLSRHVRTRGARDLDLSIYKTFKFGETKALRFDISGYNMTNYAAIWIPKRERASSARYQRRAAESFG